MSKIIRWGHVRCESADFPGAWLDAKVRPAWYWWCKRTWLFLQIVWRRWETERLGWRVARDVSRVAVGLVGPIVAHEGPPPDLQVRELPWNGVKP